MIEIAEYHCNDCRVSKTVVCDYDKGERIPATLNCSVCGKPVGWKRYRISKNEETVKITSSGYPMESDQWGCLPNQVPEFVEHARKMGCPTEYTKEGKAVFTDIGHYRKFMRCANKFYNNHTKGKE